MGDRIGVIFVDGYMDDSPVLHSHWMGRELVRAVQLWMKDTDTSKMIPGEALVNFIGWYAVKYGIPTQMDIQSDDDDCEDNGVFTVDLPSGTIC